MATAEEIGALVDGALKKAGMSQRTLEEKTGIPQSIISRIIHGTRVAKMPELIRIAEETGHTIAQLTGLSTVEGRVQFAARGTNGSGMDGMRQALLHFMELDAYLDDQFIPSVI